MESTGNISKFLIGEGLRRDVLIYQKLLIQRLSERFKTLLLEDLPDVEKKNRIKSALAQLERIKL